MKFSEHWVREWVDHRMEIDELVVRLTAAGLEVESTRSVAGSIEHLAVAEITAVLPHPGADKLSLCHVDDGSGAVHCVVCGAPNVRVGMRTAYARIGARLPDGSKLGVRKIRGVLSQGMLCSARELGLGEDGDGIIELEVDAPLGTDLVECLALDDVVIELGLTPNRGDCLCITGIAREISAIARVAISPRTPAAVEPRIDDALSITLEAPAGCPHYVGRVIRGIDPEANSPWWMAERLRRCGVRPLSVVVDVTNYVMLELGQPMHAFDRGKLDTGIQVRNGRVGESLTLLDGTVLTLDNRSLVIADITQPVALAGIMGGLGSGVTGATRDVFLESAWFEPRAIALDARRLGMHTDASHRFERTVALNLQRDAMERATQLLIEIAGGEPGPITEAIAAAHIPHPKPIMLRRERMERVLGTEISAAEVSDILARLEIQAEETQDGWSVLPPPHRPDITIEVDLIEEVARVVGFEHLPGVMPVTKLDIAPSPEHDILIERMRSLLIDRGYHEAITYSFVDVKLQARIAPTLAGLALANPIASDMGIMRTTLWSGLIGAAAYNVNRRQSRVRLFETGLVFIADGAEMHQPPMIAAIAVGSVVPEQWAHASRAVDFYDVKGDVETLLALSGQTTEFIADTHPALHPGQTAAIVQGGERIGVIGILHPEIASELRLTGAVLFELRLNRINTGTLPRFKALSKYPAVRRDVSLVLPKTTPAAAVRECIEQSATDMLHNLVLFDTYHGEDVDLDMKCMALGLTFQSLNRTLDDAEVDADMAVILRSLATRLRAVLRD